MQVCKTLQPASHRALSPSSPSSIHVSRCIVQSRAVRLPLKPLCALSDGSSQPGAASCSEQPGPLSRIGSSIAHVVPWVQPHRSNSSVRTRAAGSDAPAVSTGEGDGSNGGGGQGGGGGGGGGDSEGEGEGKDGEEVLSLEQVTALSKERGISLPADMLEVAAKYGLRLSAFEAFAALQGGWLAGFLARSAPYFRDRMMADKMFLFKVGVEVLIDSGCATVAEVRKRGKDFWGEFEFYLSDLLVGLVMDVVLVSLMTPTAVLGGGTRAAMSTSWLQKQLAKVPSAVFEASVPAVFGLERIVDMTIARKVPQIAYGTTVGIRFTNNIIALTQRHSVLSKLDHLDFIEDAKFDL
ncbi:hypothetical protein DUNSADRAFT_18105 [Dunaliella salina]|uniref:Uncharacterized protein n=1 Tax=Dunaliella salina TaxID=3046 RepID=A0ABQ7G0N2_DUNSA|nr:hypothetical protein DUNSADRAFT_18105 [Dunaliella salina]|eukprot:KAF5828165.1 hypothetical protein DUNSADRAFT_18105 [Dunaliella salina]